MAPSGEPVAETILQNIETVLAAIAEGSDYYTDVARVYRADKLTQAIHEKPAIVVAPGQSSLERPGEQVTGALAVTARYDLMLVMDGGDEPVRDIQRFMRDVHKALLADRTRGSVAYNTRVTLMDPFMPEDTEPCLVLADMAVEVDYRTDEDDLNTAV